MIKDKLTNQVDASYLALNNFFGLLLDEELSLERSGREWKLCFKVNCVVKRGEEYSPYIRRVSQLNIDDVSERREAFEASNTMDLDAIKDTSESMLVAANLVLVNLVLTVILVISLYQVVASTKHAKKARILAFLLLIVQCALAIVAMTIGIPLSDTFVPE